VSILIDRFWTHCQTYYRADDGSPTSEVASFKQALRLLNRMYGKVPISEFGPLSLKAIREAMIRPEPAVPGSSDRGRVAWSRTYTNHQVARLKMVFKWGVENEIVPSPVYQALATVAGLRRGRSEARETSPVRPVPEAMVLQVMPFLSKPIEAMVRLELLCGARGGELCIMRGRDLDRTASVWVYKPRSHKTAHHGHAREIRFGPKAIEILMPFMKMDPDAYMFSPAESELQRRAEAHEKRVKDKTTPLSSGNVPGTNRKSSPKRAPGDRYTKDTYHRAVIRACDQAFPPPAELDRGRVAVPTRREQTRAEKPSEWKARLGPAKWAALKAWQKDHRFHPHQLRHTAGTKLRKAFGLEAAGVILGHANMKVTELYAEQDRELADKVMSQVG
jgi:integrase